MVRRNQVPGYRLHKRSGQAIVTPNDTVTGERKDHLLGPYGTQASRQEYARVMGEWEARGRRLEQAAPSDLTVAELLVRFVTHAKTYYRDPDTGGSSKEFDNFNRAIAPLEKAYPHLVASQFGPAHLKVVRDRMIAAGLCRRMVNQRVGKLRHIFKWAAAEGLVSASVWHSLQVVDGLKEGRSAAPDHPLRQPVSAAVVEQTVAHLPRHVRGLVRFQQFTGARPGEACRLRMADVDTSREVWVYSPARHKTAYRGQRRFIAINRACQELLGEFLVGLSPEDFVFSPRRQREERYARLRQERKTKVPPSQRNRKKAHPMILPQERYTPHGYAHAVRAACRKAGVARWCPYQLRHAVGAKVRRSLGLDAAQSMLGHKTVAMTEHYAKLTVDDVVEVAARVV
jgi:integrase